MCKNNSRLVKESIRLHVENRYKQDVFYHLCCLKDVRRLELMVLNGSEDLQVQVWRKKE